MTRERVGKPRRLRLSLRWRVAVTFGLISVALATVIGFATWRLASQYMLDQRVQRATLQASITAQLVESVPTNDPTAVRDLLAELSIDPGSTILVGAPGGWTIAGRPVDPTELPAEIGRRTAVGPTWRLLPGGDAPLLAVAVPLGTGGAAQDANYVQLFELTEYARVLQYLRTVVVAGVLTSGVLGIAVGWWASRRALRPLIQLTGSAARAASGDLRVRLPEQNDPDLAPLAATFNATIDALEQRVKQDARFAGDVSHELRSPLTTMVNAVEVLRNRRDTFDPRAGQAVDLLATEIDHFRVMVVDLLEISRAEQDDDDRALELLDLAELVDKVSAVTPGCPGLVAGNQPAPFVVADRRRLVRLVANLLDNAHRHGGGVIRLAVSAHTDVARIEVDDAGPGVPAELRQQVFERFARVRDHPGDGGSGLGLALVARHVGLHHGAVWVEDRPGGGARFVVELPRASRELRGKRPESPTPRPTPVSSFPRGWVGTGVMPPSPRTAQPEGRSSMMRNRLSANAAPDEPAALLTTALVLALFGVLSAIEATGWIMTLTLFIAAAAAGVSGLVLRYAKKH